MEAIKQSWDRYLSYMCNRQHAQHQMDRARFNKSDKELEKLWPNFFQLKMVCIVLGPVVERVDNVIQWIKCTPTNTSYPLISNFSYLLDKVIGFVMFWAFEIPWLSMTSSMTSPSFPWPKFDHFLGNHLSFWVCFLLFSLQKKKTIYFVLFIN